MKKNSAEHRLCLKCQTVLKDKEQDYCQKCAALDKKAAKSSKTVAEVANGPDSDN